MGEKEYLLPENAVLAVDHFASEELLSELLLTKLIRETLPYCLPAL